MPRGAGAGREREHEKLKRDFKNEGRYRRREDEVASRIVNKQRRSLLKQNQNMQKIAMKNRPAPACRSTSTTSCPSAKSAKNSNHYQRRTCEHSKNYEEKHKNRTTLIAQYDRALVN
ncbi:MAG: hypothetical protein H0V78_00380 [Burkholderiales bacterium]|nr:hypothetical protein [Burkholderiales bacterium]